MNTWLGSEDRLQTPYALAVRELVAIDDLEPTLVHELDTLQEEGFALEGEPDAKYTMKLDTGEKEVVNGLIRKPQPRNCEMQSVRRMSRKCRSWF